MRTKAVAHSADYAAETNLGLSAKFGGARSTVVVPMLKDDELVGAFAIYRQEVRPFTEKQIALVQSFATQAVIAIENTRLLNELRQRTTDLTDSTATYVAKALLTGRALLVKIKRNLESQIRGLLKNLGRVIGSLRGRDVPSA